MLNSRGESVELFRPEVVEARRDSWMGEVMLTQPLSVWALTFMALTVTLVIVLVGVFSSYTRRTTVRGELMPDLGLAIVSAGQRAIIEEVFVQEGDSVTAGQPLVSLKVPRLAGGGIDVLVATDERIAARMDSTDRLGASQVEQVRIKLQAVRDRLGGSEVERAQIRREIVLKDRQMELGRSTLARFEGLAENGFASALQIDERRKEVLQLEGSRLQLKRQEVQLDNAIRQYVQDLAELKAALLGVEATTSRELETLGQERVLHHASASTVITAPIGGTVAGLQIAPGATVQLGAGLLSVVPSGSVMRAELLVPTRAIGFVRKGNRVKLRFDAFPHQKFGHQSGYVSQVALAPVTEDERPGSEPVYKVTVALDRQSVLAYGNEEALRAGMVVEVDILSETRRLIEWVLEPLYSVHGRISAA